VQRPQLEPCPKSAKVTLHFGQTAFLPEKSDILRGIMAKRNWLIKRLKFWGESLGRVMWLLILAAWTLFSNATTIRDNFLSTESQKAWDTLGLIPKWGWRTWIIGVLVIALAATLEGAYRAHRKHLAEKDKQHKDELEPIKTSMTMLQHEKDLLVLGTSNLQKDMERLVEEGEKAKSYIASLEDILAPKLEVLFEDEKPYVEHVQEPARIGKRGYWKIIRIRVKNTSGDQLYGITVELDDYEDRNFTNVPFRMMHNVSPPIRESFSLSPYRSEYIDIAMRAMEAEKGTGYKPTELCLTRMFGFTNSISLAEPRTLNLIVSASGAQSCRKRFILYVDEKDQMQMKLSEDQSFQNEGSTPSS
jgi:hypothetical protein